MRCMMRRFFLLATAALLFSSCSLLKHPTGGLKIASSTIADVYLDSKNVGTTPLSKSPLDVKKYQLKIVPQDASMAPYEGQIKIFSGFETTVDWTFGPTKDDDSGFIFEAEGAHKRDASEFEIVTSPDNVPITINNENKGFSPLVIDSLPEGDYQLGLGAPGFLPVTRDIRLLKGKRLLITAKLARKPIEVATQSALLTPPPTPAPTPVAKPKATPKPTPKISPSPQASSSAVLGASTTKPVPAKPYVEVLSTPTGFLRVRDSASASGAILGQLNIGDMVPYAGKTSGNNGTNWFKIVFNAAASAWVSGQYSKLVQ